MLPEDHPRYGSLKTREHLVKGYEQGLTVLHGLIAHGRGEAFDYLLGERTTGPAREAISAAAAMLLTAKSPVLSVNGNVAALCPDGVVALSRACGAKIEVNLFYRTQERVERIAEVLRESGAGEVYGVSPERELPGLSSERRRVSEGGIFSADVVVVALEDGDRTEALLGAGKRVIAIDLNPLSRTAVKADLTIVDNVVRAVPELTVAVGKLKKKGRKELEAAVAGFDGAKNLKRSLELMRLEGPKTYK